MSYKLEIDEELDKSVSRLSKKNKKQIEINFKKVEEILENPYQYKPLRGDMKGSRRVHIDKHFVLIYEILEEAKTVRLLDYNHHDKVY